MIVEAVHDMARFFSFSIALEEHFDAREVLKKKIYGFLTLVRETVSFVSPRPSMFPEAKSRGTVRSRGNKTHCFPRG